MRTGLPTAILRRVAVASIVIAAVTFAVPARAEGPDRAPTGAKAVAKTSPAAASPGGTTAKLAPGVVGAAFRNLGAAFDPALRNDFAFVPRPSETATAGVAALRLLETRAEAAGDRARALSAAMLVAHILRIHEEPAARGLLEAAIGAATKAGWRDVEMRTALHDLAVVMGPIDAPAAAALEKRASACPRPCATDRPTRLYAEGRRAFTALPGATDEMPLAERLATWKTVRPWLRETLGAHSAWYGLFTDANASGFEETRPFTAVEIARERLEGVSDPKMRADRLEELHRLLRKAGDYREAAIRARELADLRESLGDREAALSARHDEAMALDRLGDPEGRRRLAALAPDLVAAYSGDLARLNALSRDLVASRLWTEADAALAALDPKSEGLWGTGQYLRSSALVGRARIAMREGRLAEAEAFLDRADAAAPKYPAESPGVLQIGLTVERAVLRAAQARAADAARLRARAEADVARRSDQEPPSFVQGAMIMLRDFGGVDGAGAIAEIAGATIDAEASDHPDYETAQQLWQVAYSLALAGREAAAFQRMSRAAAIAVGRSFESVDDTDGGSLQLMRRDRWRYLLFVDIAWSAARGEPPAEMTVPSRY